MFSLRVNAHAFLFMLITGLTLPSLPFPSLPFPPFPSFPSLIFYVLPSTVASSLAIYN